jgi:hypothetical protein
MLMFAAAVHRRDEVGDLWPTRMGCWRTAQLLTGAYAETKHRVLDLLTEFALTA